MVISPLFVSVNWLIHQILNMGNHLLSYQHIYIYLYNKMLIEWNLKN